MQVQQLNASESFQQDVINILRVGTYNNSQSTDSNSIFNWSNWFPFLSHLFHLKRFPFPQVSDSVMQDERLKNAMRMSVERTIQEKRQIAPNDEFDEDEQYEQIQKEHQKRTKSLLYDMRSKISYFLLRLASLVLFKLLPSFMSGVVAHPAHIEMLKKAAENSPNIPLIFLPLHRSHLDYIMVSFILYNNEIRAPIVAAGNNLNIPFFG